ncbi:uncharacterized protein LOC104898137 [Beta vulgaris subsp. vulgaris]|uniref:uncharacterized protein LOC104898137 n=1 Tax=Beta vulgaris subsp. vulgaris TaxID=3555 RepID=UPI0025483E06|nr:uncharacterized protein LOC104898137 [Beta vulgaris subsp. vulgaris]
MSGRDKGKAKSLPTDSGHRHPHDRGVTISLRKARELLFRSTQSSSGAETEEVPEIPPLSVALPTPIMDIEAWRPHSPWRGNPMAANDQEAGTYYDSQPEHPSTDAEEGRPSRGCKPRTSRGRFARSSDGASCNAEGSGSSRLGKRKGTEEDTSWLVRDARPAVDLCVCREVAARYKLFPPPFWRDEYLATRCQFYPPYPIRWMDYREMFCSGSESDPLVSRLLTLLGATLFVDKSGNRVRPLPLSFLSCSPQDVRRYSWGAATLAYLYRQLGIASRADSAQICGCLTLLQAWIYEYFPMFRPNRTRRMVPRGSASALCWEVRHENRGIDRLLSIRQALDQTNAMQPDWLPYGICPVSAYPRSTYYGWLRYLDIVEPYMPDRTLRQLGYIQEVPHHILEPESCYRPSARDRYRVDFSFIAQRQTWDLFPRASHLMLGGLHKAPLSSMATDAYLQWYDAYSHRYIINPTKLPDGGVGSYYVEGLVPDQVLASMFGMMDPFLERDTSDLPDDFRALFEGLFGWYEAWNLTRGVDRRRRM